MANVMDLPDDLKRLVLFHVYRSYKPDRNGRVQRRHEKHINNIGHVERLLGLEGPGNYRRMFLGMRTPRARRHVGRRRAILARRALHT